MSKLEETKLSYKNKKMTENLKNIQSLFTNLWSQFTGIDEDILNLYFPLKQKNQ